MLNRRAFLKTGASALPFATAVEAVHPNLRRSAGADAEASASGGTAKLVPLPPRLAPSNPATLAWQQNIFRVGQSNMTEHDPAVMKVEEWADYWHSAGAQIVFVSVTGILAFIAGRCSSIARESS